MHRVRRGNGSAKSAGSRGMAQSITRLEPSLRFVKKTEDSPAEELKTKIPPERSERFSFLCTRSILKLKQRHQVFDEFQPVISSFSCISPLQCTFVVLWLTAMSGVGLM